MRYVLPLILAACMGCPHSPDAPRPVVPMPLIADALTLVQLTADIGGSVARRDGDAALCVTMRAIGSAARSAVLAVADHEVAIPPVALDASDCGEFKPVPNVDAEAASLLAPTAAQVAARAVETYATSLDCRERAVAVMAAEFIGSAAGPIAHALQSGVPVVELPAVAADLTGCDL